MATNVSPDPDMSVTEAEKAAHEVHEFYLAELGSALKEMMAAGRAQDRFTSAARAVTGAQAAAMLSQVLREVGLRLCLNRDEVQTLQAVCEATVLHMVEGANAIYAKYGLGSHPEGPAPASPASKPPKVVSSAN